MQSESRYHTPWKRRFGWVSGLRCCLSSSPIVSPRSSNHTNNVLHCLQIMSLQQKHSLTEIVAAEAEAERKQTQKQKQKQEQKQKQTALQTWSYGKCKFADHCWYMHDWAKYGEIGIKPSEIPCNKGEEFSSHRLGHSWRCLDHSCQPHWHRLLSTHPDQRADVMIILTFIL